MARIIPVAAALLVLPLASAQFQFNPGTYDAAELFIQISGFYTSYAAIWSTQLAQAKSSLPGAYSELTSIFNTDVIPETFDPAFVSHLAQEMVEIGHTTVIDPQIAGSTLVFSRTSSASSATPTTTTAPGSSSAASTARPSSSNSSERPQPGSTNSSGRPQPGSTSATTSASVLSSASDSDVFTLGSSTSTTATSSQSGAASNRRTFGAMCVSVALALALAGSLCLA
ncbi:hypothetical protein GGI00_001918 [Coemansia sp. RSA 2681]|nr:hypothetical protein GGI00_001918 [Coemansia sp. RSA 2681]